MQKVTAIIPTFNEEVNIKEAIESVLWADEVIVVDSFSTDKTQEIVKSFPQR
jgi:glycosyltransferase involved in cell wall biosynthesis